MQGGQGTGKRRRASRTLSGTNNNLAARPASRAFFFLPLVPFLFFFLLGFRFRLGGLPIGILVGCLDAVAIT